MANNLNRCLFRKYVQMTNKHTKVCLTSLIIKEVQIRTTMRYHFRMVLKEQLLLKIRKKNYWCRCEKIGKNICAFLGGM